MDSPAHPPLVVVMGVSGSGKSTVGALIAKALGVAFIDGDSLHPASNIAKMAAGTPLTDEDRWPWLRKVGQVLAAEESTGLVVACSSLKRNYRDSILRDAPTVFFIHLAGPREVLADRLALRNEHFMPAALFDSQLATLEPLQPDEPGFAVDIDSPVSEIVADALVRLTQGTHRPTT